MDCKVLATPHGEHAILLRGLRKDAHSISSIVPPQRSKRENSVLTSPLKGTQKDSTNQLKTRGIVPCAPVHQRRKVRALARLGALREPLPVEKDVISVRVHHIPGELLVFPGRIVPTESRMLESLNNSGVSRMNDTAGRRERVKLALMVKVGLGADQILSGPTRLKMDKD